MTTHRLTDEALTQIKKDIAAFADPGAAIIVAPAHDGVQLRWTRDRRDHTAIARASEDEIPTISVDDRTFDYATFLASEYLADLRHLAGMITRVGVLGEFNPDLYVETGAQHEVEGSEPAESAVHLIRELATQNLPSHATRVAFVHGAAGAGKSWALAKLAHDQAEAYESTNSGVLFLYANAQGANLASFDQVVAKALDDYRARFTYHAVAALSRRGRLVVILDGFDELLGSGGYGEAYSSLSDFLARLEGQGALVASARSTFYSYEDFHRAARRYETTSFNYELEPIRVLPWREQQGIDYFVRRRISAPEKAYRQIVGAARGGNKDLLEQPFFVARIADLMSEGRQLDFSAALLPQLVSEFLDRELPKIRMSGTENLLSKEQHGRFLTDLAGEMWWQEAGGVDIGTLQALAETLGEDWRLTDAQIAQFAEKAVSHGFLADAGRRRVFQHEVYYSYFLARYLVPLLLEEDPADRRRFLSRGPLPASLGSDLAGARLWAADEIQPTLLRLSRSLGRAAVAAENAGLLAAALMSERTDLPEGLLLEGMTVRQQSLQGAHLVNLRMKACTLEAVGLQRTHLEAAELVDSVLLEICVDPETTRFTGTVLRPGENIIGVRLEGEDETVFNPLRVQKVLRAMGAVLPGDEDSDEPEREPQVDPEALQRSELLKRFVRMARRQFYVDRDDERLRQVFTDRQWPRVETVMREHGVLVDKARPRRGPGNPLMMISADAEDLLRAEDPNARVPQTVRAVWKDLLTS